MRYLALLLITALMSLNFTALEAQAGRVRIKDITHIEGIRDNQLVGYGVVVGLPGTGDNSKSTQITNQALLSNLGMVISY